MVDDIAPPGPSITLGALAMAMAATAMTEFASAKEGSAVIMATSADDNHPVEHILDGLEETFWATTGLYPQVFILAFPRAVSLSTIRTLTRNVRKLLVERTEESMPMKFEKVFEVELSDRSNRLQAEVQQVNNTKAHFLRITIKSGWDDFCTVHRLSCEGWPSS
ncbi:hypothetical protein CBR_g9070 [Chara braunii]|uniref:Uncharacterized protein n=1 Tax=Chara braunii TaxID=69332 RepID=A0A388KNP5_CHABU|nr:hypothetical protein CBR_g9070 [Chara braunii]|eukprot:GBG71655.1 hypothetical protein CBR_g9070 [Chara braunii]